MGVHDVQRRPRWLAPAAALALAVLLGFAWLLRAGDFDDGTGAQSIEATWHVLFTADALRRNEARVHRFLPIASHPDSAEGHVPWGGAQRARNGAFVYTSFTAPGFLVPAAWLAATGMSPTVGALAALNALLGALAAALLLVLLLDVLEALDVSAGWRLALSVAACAVAVLSREALLSHGLVYWSHSLYQPVLAGTLWLAWRILSGRVQSASMATTTLACVLAFVGALTEWTGFVFNVGFALVLWASAGGDRGRRRLALAVLAATAIAGVAIIAHLGSSLDLEQALRTLRGRAIDRGVERGTALDLLQGYVLSFGPFVVALLAALMLALRRAPGSPGAARAGSAAMLLLAVAAFPLVENVVLMQHATQFSFDRLKFVFPAAIAFAIAGAFVGPRARIALVIASAGAAAWSVQVYRADLAGYARFRQVHEANRALVAKVAALPVARCATYSSNQKVRGYASLLVGRGVREHRSLDDAPGLMRAAGACAHVHFEGSSAYVDTPRFVQATVVLPDGTREVLYPGPGPMRLPASVISVSGGGLNKPQGGFVTGWVTGKGFRPGDRVAVDGVPQATTYGDETTLTFAAPQAMLVGRPSMHLEVLRGEEWAPEKPLVVGRP